VDARRLALTRPHAVLVNTSRGTLVDSHALADALTHKRLADAGMDVLDVEPPPADHPLLVAPNCIITPHVGWYAREARERLMDLAVSNLRAFLAGAPVNTV
jgi:glycerate dehydrogenase